VRAFRVGREQYPTADYFAWGSDHDIWHPQWLERLVAALDAQPGAVLAYPRFVRVDADGTPIKAPQTLRSTVRMTRRDRFAFAMSKFGAGKAVYGLFRASALERAGVYPRVYQPDIYLLIELSLYGGFVTVGETLWSRREMTRGRSDDDLRRERPKQPSRSAWGRSFDGAQRLVGIGPVERQHQYIYTGPVPWYARLPGWVQHVWLLWWRLVVCGRGRPLIGRASSAAYVARLLAKRWSEMGDAKRVRKGLRQEQRVRQRVADARDEH
jgi:hypothetical protein